MMPVFTIILTCVLGYSLVGFTTAKYVYWKDYALQYRQPSNARTLGRVALLWWLSMAMEPRYLRALICPTMYLDAEFRELYPRIKAQQELDQQREREIVMNQHERERALARQKALLHDKREELEFEKRKGYLARDVEAAQAKLLDDIPVELVEGATYDHYMNGNLPKELGHHPASFDVSVAEMARRRRITTTATDSNGQVFCKTHEHWTQPHRAIDRADCFTIGHY